MAEDVSVDAYTGTGVLVLFEPAQVAPRAGSDSDWCADVDVLLSLANEGLVVPINVKMDGVWLVRVTTGELTDLERRSVIQTEDRYWLDVIGHEVVFGGLEALPNRQGPPDQFVEEFGDRIPFEPGRYGVTVHRLIGPHDDDTQTVISSVESKLSSWVVVCRRMSPDETPPHLDNLPNMSVLQ